MEISQTLATESFSYSWLMNNNKPSIDDLIESCRPSNIDDDDDDEDIKIMAYSKRFLEESQNFMFDVHPFSESVHADEIFSDGHIMPLFLDRSKIESFQEPFNNFNNSSISSTPPTPISSKTDDFLERLRKFSGKVMLKWFDFLKPIGKRLVSSRKSAKVDDLERKVWEIQRCKSTTDSPCRMVKSYSAIDWNGKGTNQRINSRGKSLRKVKSWSNSPKSSPLSSPSISHANEVWIDMENTVSDAILHCKRSFGMLTESDGSKICS